MAKKQSPSVPLWYRTKFDLEGLAFGALALVLAVLVGGIPYVGGLLSLIFWIALIIVMFASRDAERTSPAGKHLVLSPCDGVIADVTTAVPPRELRWDVQEVVRIRIASSPFTVNGIRAPLTGNVESILEEDGAPSALSLSADNSDLREAFLLISGEDGVAAMRIATGGLGPRLDIDLEAGDGVRGGRKIGVRRLGGWCDVFLPMGSVTSLEPGMSVVGGETVLSSLEAVEYEHRPFTPASAVIVADPVEEEPAVEDEPVEESVAEVESEVSDEPDATDEIVSETKDEKKS